MKKLLLIILTITLLFTISSCDYLNAGITLVKGQIPSFEAGLPDLLIGTYKSLTKSGNYYDKALILSYADSFKWIRNVNEPEDTIIGKYSFQYKVFTETQMAGTISFKLEKNSDPSGEVINEDFVLTFDKRTGKAILLINGINYIYTGIPEKVE